MKGLPTTDEPQPDPPTWLAIFEFADLPTEKVSENLVTIAEKELSRTEKAEDWGRTESEVHVWRLFRAHGNGKLFDD